MSNCWYAVVLLVLTFTSAIGAASRSPWQSEISATPLLALPSPSNSPSPAIPEATPTTLSEFERFRIQVMFQNGKADATWFSNSFLDQVPVGEVDAAIAQVESALGRFRTIAGDRGDYTAQFETGTDEVLVHVDAGNKIDRLLFKPPKAQASSFENALRLLRAFRSPTGTLSYVIVQGNSERASLRGSVPLAVGSAFKLAVLAALRNEISRGRRHWSDVAPLQSRWKSLPTGALRNWPDRTPVTLATYAVEMISNSDNTAADALLNVIGPKALAGYAMDNSPFPTTREMFTLKSMGASLQREAYIAARTSAERAAVLAKIDSMPLPAADMVLSRPILDIEWHYSVRELCSLMHRVADLPLMSVNPGAADATAFRRVAFKGGSDVGVVNLTTLVTTKRGVSFCFSATLNDSVKNIDDVAFSITYASALSALANQ